MTDLDARWYAVQTQPNAETRAVTHLERQGYTTYLPRYLKRRRHARRVDVVAAPLFPRYLFVAINVEAQRWRSINSTLGVSRLVCNGEAPATISASVVSQLRAREDERGFITLERRPLYAPGDTVRILDGAFAASLGLYEGTADHDRVAILLDLLGRKVRVRLDVDAICAA